MKILCNKSLFAIAVMAAALISCSDEDAQKQPQSTEFSKTIEVFDDCGLNSIVLKLTSDDQSVVDMYSADNFQLIINPVPYDEPETDDDVEDEEDDDEIDDFSDSDAIKIGMCVVEENFVEEVLEYSITKSQPEGYNDLRAKWTKECIYNEKYTEKKGLSITRTSVNRRVYLSTRYGDTNSGVSDSDIEHGWYEGQYNNLLMTNKKTYTDYTCYHTYIGAVIEAKKHSGKYTYSFFIPTRQCK